MKNLLVGLCLVVMLIGTVATASAATVQGLYRTDFNDMVLKSDGDRIFGTYKFKEGQVNGILKGHTLNGTWVQTNAKGRLEFVFNRDFSSFTGKWGYNDAAPTRKWNGQKIGGVSPEPGTTVKPSEKKVDSPVKAVTAQKAVKPEGKKQAVPETPRKKGDGQPYLLPGQSAKYKDLLVSLLGLTRTGDYINGPEKGHVYAVLRFRVKNLGSEAASARIYSDLQWKHPQTGMRDGYQRTTGVKLNNPKGFELAPGEQGEFEEVYMFPEHLTEAEFHMLKGYNPKELARWMLPIQ